MKHRIPILFDAIKIEIVFILRRPKYMRTKKYPDERILHTKKPDLDNLTKLILDCINGILISDDSQVVNCYTRKFYATKKEEPQTIIKIESLKNDKIIL